ncbi:MAG: hypothetical protein ACK5QE_01520 [Sphingobacteriia bacterium]|jgi:hypothetical protein
MRLWLFILCVALQGLPCCTSKPARNGHAAARAHQRLASQTARLKHRIDSLQVAEDSLFVRKPRQLWPAHVYDFVQKDSLSQVAFGAYRRQFSEQLRMLEQLYQASSQLLTDLNAEDPVDLEAARGQAEVLLRQLHHTLAEIDSKLAAWQPGYLNYLASCAQGRCQTAPVPLAEAHAQP